jgi:hypothetical protein
MRYALSAMRVIDYAVLSALCSLLVLVWPGNALADSITGSLEGNYSFFTFRTTDEAGNTVKRDGNAYLSRFILNFEKDIYPNLKFSGGGIFEGTYSDVKTNDERTKTIFTRMSPFVDLTLNTPLYTAGVRYTRREDRIDQSGADALTGVNQEYSGILGWRPEGLPSAELRVIRTNTFDKDRSVLDLDKDFVSLLSRYRYKGFTADYYGAFTQTQNNIIDLKTKDLLNSGRLAYADNFFKDRVSLNTTYNISHEEVRVASEGAGFVSSQVFPFAGLSIVSDTVALNHNAESDSALVDGPSGC